MALSIDISTIPTGLSKRDIAVMAGLAKKGRGPFSKAAQDFLNDIEAKGYEFTKTAPVVKSEGPRIDTKDMDLDAFREWAGKQGYTVGDRGRIKNDYLVEYVNANPDYPKRAVVERNERVKSEKAVPVKIKPNSYDPKVVRQWAIDNKMVVPARGKLSSTLIGAYLDAHKDAPVAIAPRETPENAFAPTPERVRLENWFEGTDIDNKTKIRMSYRDVPADHKVSIGWVNPNQPIHAFSRIDSDVLIKLTPVS